MAIERTFRQTFFGFSALLFAASTAVTIVWCASMSTMKDMQMPGGWSMSMTWMPGQDWSGAALSFLGMWVVMMISMMMPSLVPMLLKYRQVIGTKSNRPVDWLSILVSAGYFFVWTIFGIAVFPLGVALTTAEMQSPALSRAVPLAIGIVVLFAGLLQFTGWKTHQLTCCRDGGGLQHDKIGQRRQGLAARDALWISLHPMLFRVNDYSSGHRGHGSPHDGCRGRCYHRRTSGTGRGARCPNHRSPGRRGRVVSHRPGSILSITSLES